MVRPAEPAHPKHSPSATPPAINHRWLPIQLVSAPNIAATRRAVKERGRTGSQRSPSRYLPAQLDHPDHDLRHGVRAFRRLHLGVPAKSAASTGVPPQVAHRCNESACTEDHQTDVPVSQAGAVRSFEAAAPPERDWLCELASQRSGALTASSSHGEYASRAATRSQGVVWKHGEAEWRPPLRRGAAHSKARARRDTVPTVPAGYPRQPK